MRRALSHGEKAASGSTSPILRDAQSTPLCRILLNQQHAHRHVVALFEEANAALPENAHDRAEIVSAKHGEASS
jgi:hypothetical protein